MQHLIYANNYYQIEHAKQCAIPGYLIIFAKPQASNLIELTPQAQTVLWQAIYQSSQIVQKIIQPERIYTLSFGEQTRQLHFHIFPRSQQMLVDFNCALKRQLDYADGAEMFNWARQYYQHITDDYLKLCTQITKAFGFDGFDSPLRAVSF